MQLAVLLFVAALALGLKAEACEDDCEPLEFEEAPLQFELLGKGPKPMPKPDNPSSEMPDFMLSLHRTGSQLKTVIRHFCERSCAYRMGCVRHKGFRRLLRFSTRTVNVGNADFEFGNPEMPQLAPWVEWNACRKELHIREWIAFSLLTEDGMTVIPPEIHGTCVEDSDHLTGTRNQRFSCEFQGLSIGWADDDSWRKPCQWLDITDIPSGRYLLRIEVNPSHVYPESDLTNNRIDVLVGL